MDPASLLVGGALIVLAVLFLFSSNGKKGRIAAKINNLPGPPVYPIVGSSLPLFFKKRNGKWQRGDSRFTPPPGKERPVPIGWEAGWSPMEKRKIPSYCWQSNPDRPARSTTP
jgi:hypothetical protein